MVILFILLIQGNVDYDKLREKMIQEQIVAKGIKDSLVIKAMRKVERHKFVPHKYKNIAYENKAIPIGHNQSMPKPYNIAIMTELLNLKGDEKVLEIGTGSGYHTAILAEIAKEVYTIEILKPLATKAESLLKELGYKNIKFKCGDGYQGWQEHSPFDCIIVTCAPTHIPQPLIEQLKIGGRMVIPIGKFGEDKNLYLITKNETGIDKKFIRKIKFASMIR